MRLALTMTAAVALCACASAPAMRDGGIATLDGLNAAQTACKAKGGTLKLKSGGNPRYLEDFACERN